MKNLWEVDHPYYCNEGNYYSNDCGYEYESWEDFISDEGESDFDMNLVFRFDWDEIDDESGENNFNGDPSFRNGKLKIFWIGQRKGIYRYSIVDVCRNDQDEVKKFLIPRLEHLKKLWEPLI